MKSEYNPLSEKERERRLKRCRKCYWWVEDKGFCRLNWLIYGIKRPIWDVQIHWNRKGGTMRTIKLTPEEEALAEVRGVLYEISSSANKLIRNREFWEHLTDKQRQVLKVAGRAINSFLEDVNRSLREGK